MTRCYNPGSKFAPIKEPEFNASFSKLSKFVKNSTKCPYFTWEPIENSVQSSKRAFCSYSKNSCRYNICPYSEQILDKDFSFVP